MLKSIIFWSGIVCLLLAGGYSIFYEKSPVSDALEFVSSEKVDAGNITSEEFRKILIGDWSIKIEMPYSELGAHKIEGDLTFNSDSTYRKRLSLKQYRYKVDEEDRFTNYNLKRVSEGYLIGKWVVHDNETMWAETVEECSSKLTYINAYESPDFGLCNLFRVSSSSFYGQPERDYKTQELKIKHFTTNEILLETRIYSEYKERTISLIRK